MKVLVKTHVNLGEDADGKPRVFAPGQVVEIDDATAKASPWAFEEQDLGSSIEEQDLGSRI